MSAWRSLRCRILKPSKAARQTSRYDIVYAKLDACGIVTSAPMEAQKPQYSPDHCMDRIPVLQMEEVQALTKDLGFVVFLDTKTLPGMNAAQALVQPLADVDHCGSPSSSAEKRRVHLCSHTLQDDLPRSRSRRRNSPGMLDGITGMIFVALMDCQTPRENRVD